MGIEYSAVLIVGLPRGDIEDQEVIDDELEAVAARYDGDGEDDAIAGIVIVDSGDYQAKEITFDQAKVDAAKEKFRKLTGQEGKLYLTPCGY
jgi:hypothetical protein